MVTRPAGHRAPPVRVEVRSRLLFRRGRIVGRRSSANGDGRDVHDAAREHGIADLAEVPVAILENHLKISFLSTHGPADQGRRRPRAN